MGDLNQHLASLAGTPVLWLALGNPDGGDDAAGLRLAHALQTHLVPNVVTAGLHPDRWIAHADFPPRTQVVFLDAAEFGGQPGAVTWLDATQIQTRFPQISTHRIALSTIARLLLDRHASAVWLLGIQPASLRPGTQLTPAVQFTLELLERLILRHFGPDATLPRTRPRPVPDLALAELETTSLTPNRTP
jgi:hydrogenase 3 maturation protease